MALGMNGGVLNRIVSGRSVGWYARLRVPADVRSIIGKNEFWSRINDARTETQALRLAKTIHAHWEHLIDLARRGEYPPLDSVALEQFARQFWVQNKIPAGQFVSPYGDGRLRAAVQAFVATKNFQYSLDGPNFGALYREIALWSNLPERDNSTFRLGRTLDQLNEDVKGVLERHLAQYQSAESALGGTGYTWNQLITAWAKERHKPEKTKYSWERIVAKLTKFLDYDDVARVSEADCSRWKDYLVEHGNLDRVTIKNHLIVVSTLFNFALANRTTTGVRENPMRPVAGSYRASKKKIRHPGFTAEQAKTILLAARSEKQPYRRWIPWIAAFSGARVDEIAGASAQDVEKIGGIWCLHIRTDHRQGATLKTESSVRTVPLADAVIRGGFIKYVESLKNLKGPLFPEIKKDRFGRRGGYGGKAIARWVRKNLKITDLKLKPNHSWRDYFKTAARRAGIEEQYSDAITGHASGSTGRLYGENEIAVLKREIDRIASPV